MQRNEMESTDALSRKENEPLWADDVNAVTLPL